PCLLSFCKRTASDRDLHSYPTRRSSDLDIISMGARPVAVMDQLRFGAVDLPDTARVVHGVVSGVGGYGNSLGLPNIGGELVFDSSYQGNPLVNALCLGVLRHEDIHLANASGLGNKVVLFGART